MILTQTCEETQSSTLTESTNKVTDQPTKPGHDELSQLLFTRHGVKLDWTSIDSFFCPTRLSSAQKNIDPTNHIIRAFEYEVERNPYSVKLWISYLDSCKACALEQRFTLYERALCIVPRSYKLWHRYLQEKICSTVAESPLSTQFEAVNNLFERCLIHLSLMPSIWLMYFDFLSQQPLITRTRRCYDRALQSLPVTQHHHIWNSYCAFVNRLNLPITAIAVYRRFLMYDASKVYQYIQLLKNINRIDEAAVVLAKTLNQDIVTVEGMTTHQLWLDLCDLISTHPQSIKSLNVEAILRSGIRKFAEQVARLWCSLARYYVHLFQMEKARDIYEEALESITTASDFGIIYEAYSQFMEAMLSHLIESETQDKVYTDLYIERLEDLIQRRPLLLSSAKLRQNPHNVVQWFHRIKLFIPHDPVMAVKTFTEAVLTVDPFQAVGKPISLWIQFAKFYEAHGNYDDVTDVFQRAVKAKYRTVDDLVAIWCAWVEFELRQKNGRRALEISREALRKPVGKLPKDQGYHQHHTFRSVRLWSLCADLEETFGSFSTLQACHDHMFDLKIITPSQILNYASYLTEHKYWEKAFRVYERGIAILRWPHVYDVWITYLTVFVSRYGEKKLERARELFEQALDSAPSHLSKSIYLLYAQLEESFGLARHAISIYDRASQHMTLPQDAFDMFMLLAAKTSEYFGITRTRPVFEKGIQVLESYDHELSLLLQFGLRFVEIERSLGEIDRARGILQHLSQFCDPLKEPDFWQTWRRFEITHGNEDVFREMLRTKRAVQALYAEENMKRPETMLEMAKQKLQNDATSQATPMDQLETSVIQLTQEQQTCINTLTST